MTKTNNFALRISRFALILLIVTLIAGLSITANAEEIGTETNAPAVEFVGQQVNLGGDISMKFHVRNNEDRPIESITVEVEFLGKLTYLTECEPHPTENKVYIYTFEGVSPQCLGDLMNVRILVDGNPMEHEDARLIDYSVEKNLLNLLEKHKDDAALVTLIKDTLAYGEAASACKNHQTMIGNTYTENNSNREIPDATVTPSGAFTGCTVVFGQVNFIKVSVALETGYTLYLDGTDITSQLVGGIFKTDGIAPTEFDKKFSFEIKSGDTVVQTFAISANDYIGAQKDSATMGNLVKTLYNYGYSAKAYNHAVNGVGEHTTVNGICTLCNENIGYDVNETTATYSVYEAEALQSVLDEASSRNGIVKLMRDITVNADSDYSLLISSGTVILDLNGYKLTSSDKVAILVAEGAALTVKDSGVSQIPGAINALSEGIQTTGIKNEGELFVESGTILANTFGILNDGTLTISGGDVGSKYHVAILGGEVILSGTPLLFNGSENTSGEYLGCDIACCTVYVEAELDDVIYTYYDSEVMSEDQNFAEFTGYSLSSDRTYFDRVN